jgi:hypothetical protein
VFLYVGLPWARRKWRERNDAGDDSR